MAFHVTATIEIPYQSNVKYEICPDGKIKVDRILSTSMVYPGNYGYIDNTLSEDGDPLDILIINQTPFYPGTVVECRIVGVLETSDENGGDEKIIAVPSSTVDSRYDNINDITDVTIADRRLICHFFENYKKLETGKYVNIGGFNGKSEAMACVQTCRNRHQISTSNSL